MKSNHLHKSLIPSRDVCERQTDQTNREPIKSVLLLMLVSVALISGCGGDPRGIARGDITGEVTFEGAPVTEGSVNFFSDKTGIAAGAKLDEKGSFTIPDGIEVGSYIISITPPYEEEEPPGLSTEEKTKKEYPDIPAKYRSGETSGLKAEVKNGENHFEFKMVK